MPRPPENRVAIDDFAGEVNNVDASDLPTGAAQVQINLTSAIIGQLTVRRGFRFAAFESEVVVEGLGPD
jgi:hypothetical protein